MKRELYTGGRFDIYVTECRIRIYKASYYDSYGQTIRLTK